MAKDVKKSLNTKSLEEPVPVKKVRFDTPKLLQRRKKPISITFKERNGTVYIYLRVNGKYTVFSSFVGCKAGTLDSKNASVKGDTIATVKLQKMRSDLLTAHAQLELAGITASGQLIRDKALKVVKNLAPNLKELLEQRIQVEKERFEAGQIRKNAYLRKINFTRHINNFFQWKYNTTAALISDIKPADAQNLFHYLTTQVRLEQEFSMKIVQWLKTGLEFAVLSGWLDRNPFAMFKGRRVQKAIVYLSEKEIDRIASLKFTDRNLTTVRDYFLFACYTGVNFKELQTLTRKRIEETLTGQQFIQKGRTKTGQVYTMYLYEEPLEILARYADHEAIIRTDALFPLISHDKTNQALKVIQHIAGIDKPLTFGIARRSAATYLINKGVSPNAVSKMLGNSVRVIEKHYAVTSSETIIREISQALNQKAQ